MAKQRCSQNLPALTGSNSPHSSLRQALTTRVNALMADHDTNAMSVDAASSPSQSRAKPPQSRAYGANTMPHPIPATVLRANPDHVLGGVKTRASADPTHAPISLIIRPSTGVISATAGASDPIFPPIEYDRQDCPTENQKPKQNVHLLAPECRPSR